MFYRSDFKVSQFNPKFSRRSFSDLRKNFKKKKIKNDSSKKEIINDDIENQENLVLKTLLSFSDNTSVHGVKYIGLELHWFER
jgi:hypothetical protein